MYRGGYSVCIISNVWSAEHFVYLQLADVFEDGSSEKRNHFDIDSWRIGTYT